MIEYMPTGFRLTHEFLAGMLGVRRVAVSLAAEEQRRGLITYSRGIIDVVDPGGLEASSCGCYGRAKQLYDRVLPASARPAAGSARTRRH